MNNLVGQQLGNYRLVRLLGQGGFAEVYLGAHVYLGSQAAIKVLTVPLSQDAASAFVAEARTLVGLSHVHIVRLLDFGMQESVAYLVMEYAPGGTLRERHPRGERVPLPALISYVNQAAEALQYAHDAHLIHRDVKPANLLVGRHGDVLLGDFGIAVLAHSSRSERTQETIGTIAYMSPEQIQGKPRRASDQYSLAVVVYEWLTGSVPFSGSFVEMAAMHCMATPPRLIGKAPGISEGLEQVVLRALAKRPELRFPSVGAFACALEQAAGRASDQTMLPVTADARPGPPWRLEDDFEGRAT